MQSRERPECNGYAVVISLAGTGVGDRIECAHCGSMHINDYDGKGYYLDIKDPDDCCMGWAEVALRKKHEPGQSFDSLMSSLNMKVN